MSDQSTLPPRPDEAELAELVWARNPDTGSPVKQMTRGKLQILSLAGYRQCTETGADPEHAAAPSSGADEPDAAAAPANDGSDDAGAATAPANDGNDSGAAGRRSETREKGLS